MKSNLIYQFRFIISLAILAAWSQIAKGQNEVMWGFSMGFSSSKWVGDADKFVEDLTEEVRKGMEDAGFENFTGLEFRNYSRIGMNFGFDVEARITDGLYFHPALMMAYKGTRIKHDGSVSFYYDGEYYNMDMMEKLSVKTNYVELPLMFVIKGEDYTKTRLFFETGPSINLLIGSKTVTKVEIEGETDEDEEDIDFIKNWNYGYNVGGGLEFGNREDGLLRLGFRYEFGMSKIFEPGAENGIYNMRNRFWTIYLAGLFID